MVREFITVNEAKQRRIERKDYSKIDCIPDEPSIEAPDGQQWVFDEEISDEFHCETLDEKKWEINNHNWLGREPGWFSRENVYIFQGTDTNALYLRSKEDTQQNLPEGYHSFSTSFVRTRKTRKYGYFEIVCRLMDSDISSAFWFSNPRGRMWTELDVFEYSTSERRVPRRNMEYKRLFATNYHVHRHPNANLRGHKNPKSYDLGFDLSSKRIKVGFNWQKDKIEWYVNDELIRCDDNSYFHQPLHLQLDSETFPGWFGLPQVGDNNLPNSFRIMYVRSWYLDGEEIDSSEVQKQKETYELEESG